MKPQRNYMPDTDSRSCWSHNTSRTQGEWKVVSTTLAHLDVSTPENINYRVHLIESACFRQGPISELVPDQLTAVAMRAFAHSLEFALRLEGEWEEGKYASVSCDKIKLQPGDSENPVLA